MQDKRPAGVGRLGVRWTIGDVNANGFESLRLSLWGARRVFGPRATYLVCVNTIPVEAARERAGQVPPGVTWRANDAEMPAFMRPHLNGEMSEGTAWKFSPLRVFPDRYELALDNDCILWAMPQGVRRWLEAEHPEQCLIAADVWRCLGQFEDLCGPEPRNSGIRGLPPGFDYGAALQDVLKEKPVVMVSELDEQGLQVAALYRRGEPYVVTAEEVTICSPFPPHLPHLGTCGAHFVGLNAKQLPWELEGRPATEYLDAHWRRHRDAIYGKLGLNVGREEPA
ncbi:MAG TPA: hypothetical protein VFG50_17305 [Rhodothermales bacterium]|nr:hypothetical protein [Rhodothermales bacterium]